MHSFWVLLEYSGLATPLAVLKKNAPQKMAASARISSSLRMVVYGEFTANQMPRGPREKVSTFGQDVDKLSPAPDNIASDTF